MGGATVLTEALPAEESLMQVADRVGRNRQTVWRWVKEGVSVGGRVVKLGARRVGGRWIVTREAWAAFDSALNPQAPTLPESASAERRRAKRESAELARRLG
jgi:hypothetical protein